VLRCSSIRLSESFCKILPPLKPFVSEASILLLFRALECLRIAEIPEPRLLYCLKPSIQLDLAGIVDERIQRRIQYQSLRLSFSEG